MAVSAAEMVVKLREALSTGFCIVSVSIDGTTTQFDRKQALAELRFWQHEAAREAGTRRMFVPIKLG
jgi:hypothetical protein